MKKSKRMLVWGQTTPRKLTVIILGMMALIATMGAIKLRPYNSERPRHLGQILKGLIIIVVAFISSCALIYTTILYFIQGFPWIFVSMTALVATAWPIIVQINNISPVKISGYELVERFSDDDEKEMSTYLLFDCLVSFVVAIILGLSILTHYHLDFNVWIFIFQNWAWSIGVSVFIAFIVLAVNNRAIGLGFSRIMYSILSFGLNKIDADDVEWKELRSPVFKGILLTFFNDLLTAAGIYASIFYFRMGYYWPLYISAVITAIWVIVKIRDKDDRLRAEKVFNGFMESKFSQKNNIHSIILTILMVLFVLLSFLYVLPQETLGFGNIWQFIIDYWVYLLSGLIVIALIIVLITKRKKIKRYLANPQTFKEFEKLFDNNLQYTGIRKAVLKKLLRSSSLVLLGEFLDKAWYNGHDRSDDRAPFAPIVYHYIDLLKQDYDRKGDFTKKNLLGEYNRLIPRAITYLGDILRYKGELQEDYLLAILDICDETKNPCYLDLLCPFDEINFDKSFLNGNPTYTAHLQRQGELERIASELKAQKEREIDEWREKIKKGDIAAFIRLDLSSISLEDIDDREILKSFFAKYDASKIPTLMFRYSKIKKIAIWHREIDLLFDLMIKLISRSFDDDFLAPILKAYNDTLDFLNNYTSKANNHEDLKAMIVNKSRALAKVCPQ